MHLRLLLVLCAVVAGGLLVPQQAAALSCPAPGPGADEQAFKRFHAAIVGELLAIEFVQPQPAGPIGYLTGRISRFRFRVLEVHKGREWLSTGQQIDAIGIYYGAFGNPPNPQPGPFGVLLNRGANGWGTDFLGLCATGISVERVRELGAKYPEGYRYAPGPRPPECVCMPEFVGFRLTGSTQHPLRRALKRGIRFKVGCNRDCSVTATIAVRAKAARRLKLSHGSRPRTIATGKVSLAARQRGTLALHFSRLARKRLRGVDRSVKATLVTTFTGGSRIVAKKRTITLAVGE